MIVVCNSTPLIGLAKVRKLGILQQLFHEIAIPYEVYNEIVIRGEGKPGSAEVKDAKWIHKKKVKDKTSVEMLAKYIGKGEAEVLVLGKELKADWLIIDEDKARNSAFAAGFRVIGLVGILAVAKRLKLIEEVKPVLDELKYQNFYLDKDIYKLGLKKVGEKEDIEFHE